ncbi:tRNA (cytidine(34)-2'-O)-methyltransferase [Microbaculum sp. FT89]|uniref:tRNA (cytidine(34)-2'-O)-methyltransferase n=1 Tax=Microbaculum sp. FT89 TaxID=3447298 RepID=UPI003F53A0E3
MIRLALYQPDIPQNTGTVLRLGACLGAPVDIIEPAGFPVSDRAFRRAGMDYLDHVALTRHVSFDTFLETLRRDGRRLVLATTRGAVPYTDHAFRDTDTVLLGRESQGVPDDVHAAAHARVLIPMRPGLRSLNVAVAAAILLSEALRQTGGLPAAGPAQIGPT